MSEQLPPFDLSKKKFKKLRSLKPLPMEQPIYFTYKDDVYACQYYDGCEKYYYNRNGELKKAETSIDHFPRMFIDTLKNVWDVKVPYGKFLDSIIFKYDEGWKLVRLKLSNGDLLVNDFNYDGDHKFIQKL